MQELGIDIETYSPIPLPKAGVYKYVSHPDFKILLISYQFEGEEVETIDLESGDEVPERLTLALKDPNILKTAFNAQFEINCFNQYEELETDITQWECTKVKAGMLNYPMKLEHCAKALKLGEQKDPIGTKLIKLFSVPNKFGKQNKPSEYPTQWNQYKAYNVKDVVVEQAIRKKLKFFKISRKENSIWLLDQKINSRGIRLDYELAANAVKINNIHNNFLINQAIELTGLSNPNSVKQLKEWILQETDHSIESLNKETVKELIKEHSDERVLGMLKIRQELAKSSVKKYLAMLHCICNDGRAKGLLEFYGATKTGRWAGRLIQVQNLTKTKMDNLPLARQLVKANDIESLYLLYDNITDLLSRLIRTAFIPSPNHSLLVSDFSAIEARVVAWFANEKWRLEVFRSHGKIYEASGARMFNTTIEAVAADKEGLRFKAKTAELALGYQGGKGSLDRMDTMGLKTGLTDEQKIELVRLWREANPNIVKFWYDVERAAINAVANPGEIFRLPYLKFYVRNSMLYIELPSGRCLCYVEPWLQKNSFGKQAVWFWGLDQETKKWSKQNTYGGKLVENIVQGTSRDLLAEKMLLLDMDEFPILMHIHDEVVIDVPNESAVEKLNKCNIIMRQPVMWAPGLPLNSESFLTDYYIKN